MAIGLPYLTEERKKKGAAAESCCRYFFRPVESIRLRCKLPRRLLQNLRLARHHSTAGQLREPVAAHLSTGSMQPPFYKQATPYGVSYSPFAAVVSNRGIADWEDSLRSPSTFNMHPRGPTVKSNLQACLSENAYPWYTRR